MYLDRTWSSQNFPKTKKPLKLSFQGANLQMIQCFFLPQGLYKLLRQFLKATLSGSQTLQDFVEPCLPSGVFEKIDKAFLQLTNKS